MPDIFSVGVDLGGTWVRLEAIDARGRSVRSLKAPSVPVTKLPSLLKHRFKAWRITPPRLVVGSRGVWTSAERSRLKTQLRRLAGHVSVMSDVEAAWHSAFGKSGAGVVVIAGTGSIAFGRDTRGRSSRAGGLGPQKGDEGSAFWIGKTWLQRTKFPLASALLQGRSAGISHDAVRRIAAQTPAVLRRAAAGNSLARSIVTEAQHHLADLVQQVAESLHLKGSIPVSWGGGLMNNPPFRAGVFRALQAKGHPRINRVAPHPKAALAIARLTL